MNSESLSSAGASTDKTWAVLAHIGGFLTSWLVPLVIFLIKKSDPKEEFSTANAREALNFQITLFLVYFACFILAFVIIGLLLFWLACLANLVLSIVAAVKASNGEVYRYPLTLRLVK